MNLNFIKKKPKETTTSTIANDFKIFHYNLFLHYFFFFFFFCFYLMNSYIFPYLLLYSQWPSPVCFVLELPNCRFAKFHKKTWSVRAAQLRHIIIPRFKLHIDLIWNIFCLVNHVSRMDYREWKEFIFVWKRNHCLFNENFYHFL